MFVEKILQISGPLFMSGKSNPFYVLSESYKRDMNKQNEKVQTKERKSFLQCPCNPQYKGHSSTYENWCKDCREFDNYINDWSISLMKEKNEEQVQ